MYSTGMTFKLKPGCYPEYKKAHDELWPDMVEVLLENRERLKPNDLKWIQDIDATAAGLVGITFTPRQQQVIRDIYLKYYAGAS